MRILLLLLVCIHPVLAATPPTRQVPAGKGAKATMQQYGDNMSILLENLQALDNSPSLEQRNRVVQALTLLKGLSHDIQPTLASYAVDPIMLHLSVDLPKQFARISDAYSAHNYPYARTLLRQTTQYCVGCHAASSNKNSALPLFTDPRTLGQGLEKAEFLSATRRHEEAMVAYEQALADKTFKLAQPELWEKAVLNLLAITIRLRSDASITYEMISALIDEGGYRPEQLEKLQIWRSAAKSWAREPPGNPATAGLLLEKSQELLARGRILDQKGRLFGLVEDLRAATLLNQLSMNGGSAEQKAQAYRLMAEINEQLLDVFLWMRPEAYYEACIRVNPHSPVAKTCASDLQALIKDQKDPFFDSASLKALTELAQEGRRP